MKTIKMSEADFRMHRNDYNGICESCGAVRWGETEPDAEEYPCEECGEDTVTGIENALLGGIICITE
jgi:predicted RNA-binding Zn-ribbon protein involved in translation (DUF1610 family)